MKTRYDKNSRLLVSEQRFLQETANIMSKHNHSDFVDLLIKKNQLFDFSEKTNAFKNNFFIRNIPKLEYLFRRFFLFDDEDDFKEKITKQSQKNLVKSPIPTKYNIPLMGKVSDFMYKRIHGILTKTQDETTQTATEMPNNFPENQENFIDWSFPELEDSNSKNPQELNFGGDSIFSVRPASLFTILPNLSPLVSTVRTHRGSFSNKLTKSLNADAVTLGNDIFFSDGKFNLDTPDGLALFSHELTHVIQNKILSKKQKALDSIQYREFEKDAQANENFILTQFSANQNNDTLHISDNENLIDFNSSSPLASNRISNLIAKPLLANHKLSIQNSHIHPITNDNFYNSNINRSNFEKLSTNIFNHSRTIKPSSDKKSITNVPNSSFSNNPVRLTFLNNKKTEVVDNSIHNNHGNSMQTRLVPMLAGSNRSTEANNAASQPTPTNENEMQFDINKLADRVYAIIVNRIKLERDRIGYR